MALELEDQPWAYLDALTSRIEALRRRVEAIPDELPQTIGPSNNNRKENAIHLYMKNTELRARNRHLEYKLKEAEQDCDVWRARLHELLVEAATGELLKATTATTEEGVLDAGRSDVQGTNDAEQLRIEKRVLKNKKKQKKRQEADRKYDEGMADLQQTQEDMEIGDGEGEGEGEGESLADSDTARSTSSVMSFLRDATRREKYIEELQKKQREAKAHREQMANQARVLKTEMSSLIMDVRLEMSRHINDGCRWKQRRSI